MKIITVRIDEEEKARLEHLAERSNVTLSRALREGAALYLGDLLERRDAPREARTTVGTVRRDKSGAADSTSTPSAGERAMAGRLQAALGNGLSRVRDSWLADDDERVVLAALRNWLSLVGRIYARDETYAGWSWFLEDYCPGYDEKPARDALEKVTRAALVKDAETDVGALIEPLRAGLEALLSDIRTQEPVRRAVLAAWKLLEQDLA